MDSPVTYRLDGSIATIVLDDGKRNALSPQVFAALNVAFDRAQAERAAIVLTGRDGVFSAGFDLRVLTSGGREATAMLLGGFRLAERMLQCPTPVVIACTGHALAMGLFLVLAGDYRVGAAGPYKIQANEVAIGLTMPFFGVEICRQRLAPAHFNRAVINAECYAPEDAVAAGFLDRIVPPGEVLDVARATAASLLQLNADAHAATKLRARAQALAAIRGAIEADAESFRALFGDAA